MTYVSLYQVWEWDSEIWLYSASNKNTRISSKIMNDLLFRNSPMISLCIRIWNFQYLGDTVSKIIFHGGVIRLDWDAEIGQLSLWIDNWCEKVAETNSPRRLYRKRNNEFAFMHKVQTWLCLHSPHVEWCVWRKMIGCTDRCWALTNERKFDD